MSVIVKGMEMPKNCEECDLKVWDEYDAVDYVCPFSGVIVLNIGRQGSCPLVEVPPHGRLIDADALMNEFKILQSGREIFGMELDSSFLSSGQELSTEWYCVEDAIEDAPTIIEAEEGE